MALVLNKQNLTRRYKRYIDSHKGIKLEIPSLETMKELETANTKLLKLQAKDRFVKSVNYHLDKAYAVGLRITAARAKRIRGEASLNKLKADIEKRQAFNADRAVYIERLTAWNQKMSTSVKGQFNLKYMATPSNRRELTAMTKDLEDLEKGDYKRVFKKWKVSDKDAFSSLRATTLRYAEDRKWESKIPTYGDERYADTVLKEAAKSEFPELELLFNQIGTSGIIELTNHGFGIMEFANSDKIPEWHSREYIIATLRDIAENSLLPSLQDKVLDFLAQYGG